MRPRQLLLACLVLAGCDQAPTPTPARAPAHHGKPMAAVDVQLDAVPRGGGDFEVTLTATPTVATDALELQLDGQKLALGAVGAGVPRTMTTRVHVGARGRELFGGAAVGQGNQRRSRAASTWIGPAPVVPAKVVNVITLPDGNEMEEVRE